jgi:hypothetical protein
MAKVPVVPKENPEQTPFWVPRIKNPFQTIWWGSQSVSGVPENVMGWLVAQGWQITGITPDTSTVPPTIYYSLGKEVLDPIQTVLSLTNSYITEANYARTANNIRYTQVVRDWTETIFSSHRQFEAQADIHNADLGLYVTDLGEYMDAIDVELTENYNDLNLDYVNHQTTTRELLNDLGSTEVARINEQYTATLSAQLQDLTDRGLYSSATVTAITTRVHRDRDEQLQKHYDSLAREKLGNEHQLWSERVAIAQIRNQIVQQKMGTAVAKLEGWKHVAAENQRLMAYQLDTRNQLIIGLYSFVERRSDIAPEWRDMSQMIAGLADPAGGWITP